MKTGFLLKISSLLLILAPFCFSQDPLPVLRSTWRFTVQPGKKAEVPTTGPARQITVDDTNVARTNRQFQTDHPEDPSQQTPDGRRAIIEKNEQEARQPQPTDVRGFTYSATVRNE